MAQRVFEVPSARKAELEKYLATDPISRLSITVKDARHFGVERAAVFAFIEGDEAVLQATRADFERLEAREPENASELFETLKREEDDAAGGVGFIFG